MIYITHLQRSCGGIKAIVKKLVHIETKVSLIATPKIIVAVKISSKR
jgi:hypothetical protein